MFTRILIVKMRIFNIALKFYEKLFKEKKLVIYKI
jgi:hypothetical protein